MRPILQSIMFSLLGLLVAACGTAQDAEPSGDLLITLSWDQPPQVGRNTLTVEIADAAGAEVAGATVEVTPYMPHHGHGSTESSVVTHEGAGLYRAFPVTLQMPGMWEITVRAEKGLQFGEDILEVTVE